MQGTFLTRRSSPVNSRPYPKELLHQANATLLLVTLHYHNFWNNHDGYENLNKQGRMVGLFYHQGSPVLSYIVEEVPMKMIIYQLSQNMSIVYYYRAGACENMIKEIPL